MRRLTTLDWLGGTVIWGITSIVSGVFVSEVVGMPEEAGVTLAFTMFFGAIVAARLWVLRQPEQPRELGRRGAGLTTGEAQMTRLEEVELRLAEMEALHDRVAELEERLDFSERLLASGGPRKLVERNDA